MIGYLPRCFKHLTCFQDTVTLSADCILDHNKVDSMYVPPYVKWTLWLTRYLSTASILSGYSRFPIHDPRDPTAFLGTLLVKKVCLMRYVMARWRFIRHSSFWLTTPQKHFLSQLSSCLFSPKRTQQSTVSRPWIICKIIIRMSGNCIHNTSSSQTGRAHLLLISTTPGRSGGAIGVITLEGTLLSLTLL